MKLSPSDLKNLDFKQLALDHGEKFVVALIGLIVVGVLASTRWSPYSERPNELAANARDRLEEVRQGEWEEEAPDYKKYQEEGEFVRRMLDGESYRVLPDVAKMLEPIQVTSYEYSQPLAAPLLPGDEPISEPKWFAVQEPVADFGRALLALNAGSSSGEDSARESDQNVAQNDQSEAEEDATRKYELRTGRGGGRGNVGAGPGSPGGGTPGGPGSGYASGDPQLAQRMQRRQEQRQGPPEGIGGGGYGSAPREYGSGSGNSAYGPGGPGPGGSAGTGVGTEARGYRYVAVRGIFPLRRQLQELVDKLNLATADLSSARSKLVFQDFKIQRQRAVDSQQGWTEWQEVDRRVALEVLRQTVHEAEPLEQGVIDPTFTMPLPMRVVGYWGDHATHPGIKNFELSPEQLEKQVKIQRELLEQQNANENAQQSRQLGGFASLRADMGALQRRAAGNEDLLRQVAKGVEEDGGQNVDLDQLKKEIKQSARASDNLLLFRFFDFDVDPGQAYRYRVRLVVRNPNHGLPPEQVAHPGVVAGETRQTPWSKPTPPVVVQDDTHYFLNNVLTDRRLQMPKATMEIFHWLADAGTTVHVNGQEVNLGQFIGGEANVEVIRPAAGTFQLEDIRITSRDALLDLVQRPRIDPQDHPDLDLPTDNRRRLDFPDQGLVLNGSGQLVRIDPTTRQHLRPELQKELQQLHKAFEHLKDQPQDGETPDSGLNVDRYLTGGEQSGRGETGRRQSSQRYASPAQRSGGYGSPPTSYGGPPQR